MNLLLDEPRCGTVPAIADAHLRRVARESFGRVRFTTRAAALEDSLSSRGPQALSEVPARTGELLPPLARRVREASGRLAEGA